MQTKFVIVGAVPETARRADSETDDDRALARPACSRRAEIKTPEVKISEPFCPFGKL